MNRAKKSTLPALCMCQSGKKYTACCSKILKDPQNPHFAKAIASVPVTECFLTDTLDTGLIDIFVVRTLPNKKLALGMYLVDFLCLGVKNAHIEIGVTEDAVEEQKMLMDMLGSPIASIEYEELRSLVLGSVAYAAQFGFKPHPDFSTAQYFIEPSRPFENSYTFGEEGKPLYISGPSDDDLECDREMVERVVIAAGGRVVHPSPEELDEETD